MCQHSWYDKSRRHYGPKPNTRRARGLPHGNLGIKRGPKVYKQPSNLQPVEVDMDVKQVDIPRSMTILKKYIRIYNWYVHHYETFPDRQVCMTHTAAKFGKSIPTVRKAIDVCKYILATTPQE